MLKRHLIAAAALASLAIAGGAHAATYTLDLTGQVADGSYSSFTSGGVTYSSWTLPLSGLDSANGPTVSQGDKIDGTISLDHPFTVNIPRSNYVTNFLLALDGTFPTGSTGTSGTMTLYNGATEVAQGSAGGGDSNELALAAGFGSGVKITFDSIDLNYSITQLSGPASLNSATFYTYVPGGSGGGGGGGGGGVPEPATWGLMLIGLGGLGATLRQRRRLAVAVS